MPVFGIVLSLQFVYHAWITDSKTAMKERSKERRRFWQRYTEGRKTKKDQREGMWKIQSTYCIENKEKNWLGPGGSVSSVLACCSYPTLVSVAHVHPKKTLELWIGILCVHLFEEFKTRHKCSCLGLEMGAMLGPVLNVANSTLALFLSDLGVRRGGGVLRDADRHVAFAMVNSFHMMARHDPRGGIQSAKNFEHKCARYS